jgi:hypothetical protein
MSKIILAAIIYIITITSSNADYKSTDNTGLSKYERIEVLDKRTIELEQKIKIIDSSNLKKLEQNFQLLQGQIVLLEKKIKTLDAASGLGPIQKKITEIETQNNVQDIRFEKIEEMLGNKEN